MTVVTDRLHPPVATFISDQATQERHEVAPGPRRFRPDIQGLRAIAVALVVLYHAKVPGIRGGFVGVDVFFVISGFLITGQLIRAVDRRGRVHFFDFYLKRIRRLLPPAAIVVVFTVVAARIFAPFLQTKSLGMDAIYTAFYGLNYRLASQGVSYQNATAPPSALQHFWSLAVEEQYYIIWPVLIMIVVLVTRRFWRVSLPVVLTVGVGVSLYVSQALLKTNAPLSYFSIQSRAWELGIGALVALAAAKLVNAKRGVANVASWVGLVALLASGLIYSDSTRFPGYHALLPVVATAVVIAAGCHHSPVGAEAILDRRPLQGLGRVSYSFYLWHWPLLLLCPMISPKSHFNWILNVEMMAIALWLAILTHFLIEYPTKRLPFHRPAWLGAGLLTSGAAASAGIIAIATLPVLVGTGAAQNIVSTASAANASYLAKVHVQIVDATKLDKAPSNLTPDLATAANDLPATSHSGNQKCMASFLVTVQGPCVYGDPNGTKTAVLFGDSHAEQWQPAYDEAAKREHWKLISWTKAACSVAQMSVYNPQLNRQYTECVTWRNATIKKIVALHPDLLIMGQSDSVPGKSITDSQWAANTMATLKKFTTVGIPVTYMMDTVYPKTDIPTCIASNLNKIWNCAASGRYAWIAQRHQTMYDVLTAAKVPVVESSPWQCADGHCPAIIGNILVYRDNSHISATFSRWLAPLIEPVLKNSP